MSEASDDLGYVLGFNAPVTALIWAAIYFSLLRKSGWKVGLPFLLAIFATAVMTNYAIAAYEKTQARQMTANIQSAYDNARAGRPIPNTLPAAGEFAPLQAVISKGMVESAAARKNYGAEIAASGVEDLLNPDIMETHPSDAAARVARARAVIVKYRDLYAAQTAEERTMIANSGLAENLKAQALEGFDESASKAKVLTSKLFDDDSAAVDEIAAISQQLEQSPTSWTVQNHQFVFNDARNLNAYNGHILEIQRLAREVQAIHQQADRDNQARLNEMRQLSN